MKTITKKKLENNLNSENKTDLQDSLSTSKQTNNPLDFFGTYDVRGIVSETTFDEAQYTGLAIAFSMWLKQQLPVTESSPWVVVGYDARVHSLRFFQCLTQQLQRCGVSVLDVGLVPSPLVYFAESYSAETELLPGLPELSAGLVVTASHNPGNYNGLKFTFNKKTINKEQLNAIKAIYQTVMTPLRDENVVDSPLADSPPVFDAKAAYKTWNAIEAYRNWTLRQFGPFKTCPKIVVDCGNGSGGVIVPQLLTDAGCEVISLYEEPDGTFPNHHPDPCIHENLESLIEAVIANQADFGVAFDGDADRLGVVDSLGRIVPGDMLLLLYAKDLLSRTTTNSEKPVIVSEVKCSKHLFSGIEEAGGIALMNPTGHAFIKERMLKEGAVLGGELSGHLFFRDKHWGFDDAAYAMMRLVSLLEKTRMTQPGCKLDTLVSALPQSVLSEEKRIAVDRSNRESILSELLQSVQSLEKFAGYPIHSVLTTDGIRVNFEDGFWLVRTSNTEPCFTIRAEASSALKLETIENQLLTQLGNMIERVQEEG
ncbi:MAG: phosphomannomutase/phosphoglucomutase [Cyanobacteria bacterium P01_H01_bin.74]